MRRQVVSALVDAAQKSRYIYMSSTNKSRYIYMFTYVCMHVCMYVCLYVYTQYGDLSGCSRRTHMCVYMNISVHVCI